MGVLIIDRTRTRVIDIAVGYEIHGHSPDEVDGLSARDAENLGLTDEEQLIYVGKEQMTIFTS